MHAATVRGVDAADRAEALGAYGWGDRWAALLALAQEEAGADLVLEPARVLRHHGSALAVVAEGGERSVPTPVRLDPPPAVGDWVVLDGERVVGVLDRTSLLRRGTDDGGREQALAANVDLVLVVCGLDRPVKVGRVQRASALAWDAGAVPLVVLAKADLVGGPAAPEVADVVAELEAGAPGTDVLVTSVRTGEGLDRLVEEVAGRSVVLLGESGAGKSSLANALVGADVAATGEVRTGDAKGRHTTTTRELHPLPGGGVLVDTPGIRSVGLWVDPEAVSATFTDIDELAEGCRFRDCRHDQEPGCAVRAAVEDGTLAADRFERWTDLRREAEAAERRSSTYAQRKHERALAKVVKDAQKRKRP